MQNMDGLRTVVNQMGPGSADEAGVAVGPFHSVCRNVARLCLKGAVALGAVFVVAAVTVTPVLADSLSDIKKSGVVRFGVKADVKPWAYTTSAGKPIGFEIDMAKVLAKRLGAKPEFITVTSANRIQYLKQGRIDITLATMSNTAKRRKIVRMIEPNYYGYATNLMAPAGSKFKTWPDLKGAVLCAVNGAIYNKWVAQKYDAEVKAFKGPPEVIAAMKQNQCEGFIYSDQIMRIMLDTDAELKGYVVALEPVNTDFWAIAVNLDSEDDSLAAALSESISAIHKSGKMLELANGHGLGGNPFLRSQANQ